MFRVFQIILKLRYVFGKVPAIYSTIIVVIYILVIISMISIIVSIIMIIIIIIVVIVIIIIIIIIMHLALSWFDVLSMFKYGLSCLLI